MDTNLEYINLLDNKQIVSKDVRKIKHILYIIKYYILLIYGIFKVKCMDFKNLRCRKSILVKIIVYFSIEKNISRDIKEFKEFVANCEYPQNADIYYTFSKNMNRKYNERHRFDCDHNYVNGDRYIVLRDTQNKEEIVNVRIDHV